MTTNKTQIVSELDFAQIKANLSAFIANNSTFTDYNFSGSALSVLTDILAYNTHYNAVYLNMALNENFIDTAQTRGSIVSLAKNFGYTPGSKKSSLTELSFILQGSPSDENKTIVLDKSIYFTSTVNNSAYVFYPIESASAVGDSSGRFFFDSVKFREGSTVSIRYTATGDPNQKFIINNYDIDLSSIEVVVLDNAANTATASYNLISDITVLTPDSTIFYLFETPFKTYEITFGDGVLGKKLSSGNVVVISYQTSSGSDANGCNTFTLATPIVGPSEIFGNNNVTFTNVVTSYGGDSEESIDSIRINALQNFRTQGRAVTAEDYKFFISKEYPLAQTISVWGGQDAVPTQYGKVFISFKPVDGFYLSNAAKADVLSIIKSKNILSVIPEIVDPTYLFLQINSTVKFSPKTTTYTANDIKSLVITAIQDFNNTTLTQFGTTFNYSKFSSMIDSVDSSILGNITTFKMRKNFPIILNKSLQYTEDFQNPIHPGSIEVKYPFKAVNDRSLQSPTEDLYIDDDGAGAVRIFKYTGVNLTDKTIINPKAGTVDYETGVVTLINFSPSSVNEDGTLDLIAKPSEFSIGDITTYRNNIITILDSEILVDVQVG